MYDDDEAKSVVSNKNYDLFEVINSSIKNRWNNTGLRNYTSQHHHIISLNFYESSSGDFTLFTDSMYEYF